MVNLVGSVGAGSLTALLALQMPEWPRSGALSLVYLLMGPFLLVPPLWTLVGTVFAVRLLRGGLATGFVWIGWAGTATGVLLAILAWPPYFRGLYALITVA